MDVVDDVRADGLGEKSSRGTEVTTEDRPGHVRRRAQIMRKRTLTPRFFFRVEVSSFQMVFIRSAKESIWSPLKESRLLRWVWAFTGDAWSCDNRAQVCTKVWCCTKLHNPLSVRSETSLDKKDNCAILVETIC